MFHHFQGELTCLEGTNAVIDCGGVGYCLCVSAQTSARLSAKQGSKVFLYAYLQVREDAMELYGFAEKEELEAFRQLIQVSGVGPKAAISILSVLTVEQLSRSIATEDAKSISRAPGVGPKTAARIVLDLKDKFRAFAQEEMPLQREDSSFAPASSAKTEATNALLVLGFTRAQALHALSGVDGTLGVEAIIAQALKHLT